VRCFVDRCLSFRIANALQALVDREHDVKSLDSMFAPNTPDVDWITRLAKDGDWRLITADNLWKTAQQKEVLKKSRLIAVWLSKGWGNQRPFLQASRLFQDWESIVETVVRAREGAWFELPFRGKIRPM